MRSARTQLRSLLKDAVERVLASSLARAVGQRRLCGARLTLAYHNVTLAERPVGGDASLHLPFDQFRSQLDAILEARLEVVRVDAPAADPAGRPQIAITFDDAYAGAVELAVPELSSRGWPTTVFVAPALLGSAAPWWDLLADPRLKAVPAAIRRAALAELAGDAAAVMAQAAARSWPLQRARAEHRIATAEELDAMLARHSEPALAAHSWSHPNLAAVDQSRLHHELTAPLQWLRARWPDRTLPWLAYPYGLESAAARSAAAGAGYEGALLVTGGWRRGPAEQLALPRLNVTPGVSLHGFRARLSGAR